MSDNTDSLVMGIDVGSSNTCVAVCDLSKGELHLKGAATSLTTGLVKGQVVDPDAFLTSVSKPVDRVERELRQTVSHVIINAVPYKFDSFFNTGLVVNSSMDGMFTEENRIEVIKRSKNVIKGADQRILHALPIHYRIDGNDVLQPVGKIGRNLEVDTHIMLTHKDSLAWSSKAVRTHQKQLNGLCYDLFGTAALYLTESERKEGVILVDFGAQFTKVGVFKNQLLYQSDVIPIGGITLTQDLSICLNVSVPEGERLKILYGSPLIFQIDADEDVELTLSDGSRHVVKRQHICAIIEARVQELLGLLRPLLDQYGDLPIVISGGGAMLKGLSTLMETEFSRSVRNELAPTVKDILANTSYATAVGLIIYGIRIGALQQIKSKNLPVSKKINQWMRRLF